MISNKLNKLFQSYALKTLHNSNFQDTFWLKKATKSIEVNSTFTLKRIKI